jgi:hypothetical protein
VKNLPHLVPQKFKFFKLFKPFICLDLASPRRSLSPEFLEVSGPDPRPSCAQPYGDGRRETSIAPYLRRRMPVSPCGPTCQEQQT